MIVLSPQKGAWGLGGPLSGSVMEGREAEAAARKRRFRSRVV